jgi:hypothetical protein
MMRTHFIRNNLLSARSTITSLATTGGLDGVTGAMFRVFEEFAENAEEW